MFTTWDGIRIPAFLTDEEWNFCKKIFDKGRKGTATKEEVEKVNKLIEKNDSHYECDISQEEYEKVKKEVTKKMMKSGLLSEYFEKGI